VAGGAVSVAGRKQGHTAADWPQYCCELLQLRSEFGKASATALQADQGWHAAIEVRGAARGLHHQFKTPLSFLIGEGGVFGKRNGKFIEIGEVHAAPLRFGKAGEREPLLGREVRVDRVSHLLKDGGHAVASSLDAGLAHS